MSSAKVAAILILVLWLGFSPAAWAGEDAVDLDTPFELKVDQNQAQPDWQSPDISTQMLLRPYQWSLVYGQTRKGDHEFQVVSGLSSSMEAVPFGDPMETGFYSTSMTYRYHGLLGGVVRPVARFTVGGGQLLSSPGDGGYLGYTPGYGAYGTGEVGVEIVYKGVGVGVTAAYTQTLEMENYRQDDKYTGGVYAPKVGWDSFKDWFTNVYLIVE